MVSFGVLASIPIAGGLLDAVEGTGKEKYWGVALFAQLCGRSFVFSMGQDQSEGERLENKVVKF